MPPRRGDDGKGRLRSARGGMAVMVAFTVPFAASHAEDRLSRVPNDLADGAVVHAGRYIPARVALSFFKN